MDTQVEKESRKRKIGLICVMGSMLCLLAVFVFVYCRRTPLENGLHNVALEAEHTHHPLLSPDGALQKAAHIVRGKSVTRIQLNYSDIAGVDDADIKKILGGNPSISTVATVFTDKEEEKLLAEGSLRVMGKDMLSGIWEAEGGKECLLLPDLCTDRIVLPNDMACCDFEITEQFNSPFTTLLQPYNWDVEACVREMKVAGEVGENPVELESGTWKGIINLDEEGMISALVQDKEKLYLTRKEGRLEEVKLLGKNKYGDFTLMIFSPKDNEMEDRYGFSFSFLRPVETLNIGSMSIPGGDAEINVDGLVDITSENVVVFKIENMTLYMNREKLFHASGKIEIEEAKDEIVFPTAKDLSLFELTEEEIDAYTTSLWIKFREEKLKGYVE